METHDFVPSPSLPTVPALSSPPPASSESVCSTTIDNRGKKRPPSPSKTEHTHASPERCKKVCELTNSGPAKVSVSDNRPPHASSLVQTPTQAPASDFALLDSQDKNRAFQEGRNFVLRSDSSSLGSTFMASSSIPSPRWSSMGLEELCHRYTHLKQVRLHAMEKRASIVCGDGLFNDSIDYLKIEEQLCASRMSAIEDELKSRGQPVNSPLATPQLSSSPSMLLSSSQPQTVPSQHEPESVDLLDENDINDDDDFDMLIPDEDLVQMEIPTSTPTTTGAGNKAPPSASLSEQSPIKPTSSTRFYPWDDQVRHSLHHIFLLKEFRADQLEAINATLSGRDVFCLMPTGGGKSLCYQLPSTITLGRTNGLTVVVSPLLALIHNQVKSLLSKDVPAMAITGDMSDADRRYASSELLRKNINVRLLYVTPEFISKSRLASQLLQHLYQTHQLARFVIDEAHCVDQWGHDFRPDYVRLNLLRKTYPTVPIMALTATARIDTVQSIQQSLGMRNALVLRQSFNRPNLTYKVCPKMRGSATLETIAAIIQKHHANECGIIYCLSRRDCENVSTDLGNKYGIQARHFHAGLNIEDKLRIQEGWEAGTFKVIVATIAFGMGIDKADVRFVIHHSMPKSLEGYYQETGRAGRDGKWSDCILFWSMEDSRKLEAMIDESPDASAEQKRLQIKSLYQVRTFCESLTECRRTNILKYFGEKFDPKLCHASCDNCQRSPAHCVDMTTSAKDFANMVKLITQQRQQRNSPPRFTRIHFVNVFRGSQRKEVKDHGHHHNLYHGSGAHYSDDQVRRLVDHLLNQKVLAEYSSKTRFQRFANYYLQLGPNASKLLQGHMSVRVDMPSNPSIGAASTSRRSNTSTALHGPTSVRAESPSSSDDMDLTFISLSPHRMKSVAAPAAAHQSVSTAPSSGVLVGKKGTAASKTTSPARPLADRTNRLATGPVATPHVHIAAMPLRKPPVRRK